jgi:hypothetical protein
MTPILNNTDVMIIQKCASINLILLELLEISIGESFEFEMLEHTTIAQTCIRTISNAVCKRVDKLRIENEPC